MPDSLSALYTAQLKSFLSHMTMRLSFPTRLFVSYGKIKIKKDCLWNPVTTTAFVPKDVAVKMNLLL